MSYIEDEGYDQYDEDDFEEDDYEDDEDYVEENPCDNCDGHIPCLECPYC